ncbi:MAG: hypothetical protein ACRDK2_17120 [Solirubrobacteraceae bacterium]
MSSREHLHKMIEEISEEEAALVLEVFNDRRRHEAPGAALGRTLLQMCRARVSPAANN